MLTKDQLRRQALLVPCKTKQALKNWFKVYLGFEAFDCVVSRHATSSPMDAAWETYTFALNPPGRAPKRYLFAAGRSTQKTITLAAVETAILLHTGRNCLHFAGSKDQVDTAYSYMKQFFNKDLVRDLIQGEIKASETIFIVPKANDIHWLDGKKGEEILKLDPNSRIANIKVLPISPFTVQSKHEPVVSTDEIHTLKGEKAYAYKDIRKIPTASHDGKPWIRLGISSRKAPDSLVEMEMASAKKTGLIVKNWTVLEGVERCPDERSGVDFVHERHVDIIKGDILTQEEFAIYDGKDKDKYDLVKFASQCLTCPMASVCKTDLKKQTGTSKHLQSIEAAITDYTGDQDRSWYLAQCMSMQPSKEGLVFSRYDEDIHHISADEMYELFMGVKPKVPQTQESLIRLFRMKGLTLYAGLDWGYTDPFAIVLLFTDGERAFVVHSFAKTNWEVEKDIVPYLKSLTAKFGHFRIFPDTARPDNNNALKGHEFDVFDDFVKKIDTGVTKIRSFLSPMAGAPKLYLLKDHCESLDEEMKMYHRIMNLDGTPTDEIADEWNHSVDGLRYIFLNVFVDGGKFVMVVGSDSEDQSNLIPHDPYSLHINKPMRSVPASQVGSTGNTGFSWDFGNSGDD